MLAGAASEDGEPEELSSPQATKEAIATAARGKRTFLEIIVTPLTKKVCPQNTLKKFKIQLFFQ
jgi:hypothetical protein